MKENIYIDFDGTIYDSNNFYNEFMKICKNYGIASECEKQAENELFNSENLFNLNVIAEHLSITYKLPTQFLREIENLYSMPNVYNDVIDSLKILNSTNKYKIVILTYGDYNHQLKKIQHSDITKYIDEVIITDQSKTSLTSIDYKNSIFIDNNPVQIEEFAKAGATKIFRIRRDIDKYSTIPTKSFIKEYNDLLSIVKKELI